jgi:serine protease Do
VVAIGNPFALSHTVTVGVISATSRPFPVEGRQQRVLQTDAAVNPGNSGGPLLNLRGEVVGINTAIVPGGGGTNVGVGFAVPINLVRDLIPQLRQGDVQHGRLGVQVRDVPDDAAGALGLSDTDGVLVASVESGGPAAAAGLKPGDVILSVNGEEMDDAEELVSVIGAAKPGSQIRLVLVRDSAKQEIAVTLGQLTTGTATPQRGPAVEEGLGLTLSALTPEVARQLGAEGSQGGAVVTRVRPASPAAEAGVQTGDVVIEVNREPVRSLDATMSRVRASAGAGAATFLLVLRDGQRVFLVVGKPE